MPHLPTREQLHLLIRAFLIPLLLYYSAFGIGFFTQGLSVLRYGGNLTSPQLWGTLYLIAALSSFVAICVPGHGIMVRVALVINALVTMMWMITRTGISIRAHIDYIAPLNALGWLVNIVIMAYIQGLIHPVATMPPWLQMLQRFTERGLRRGQQLARHLTGDRHPGPLIRGGVSDTDHRAGQSKDRQ